MWMYLFSESAIEVTVSIDNTVFRKKLQQTKRRRKKKITKNAQTTHSKNGPFC